MRFGYWMPVFGGWLRNVDDEGMEASWEYVSRLARRSEEIGFDLTLLAELFLNDIKGRRATGRLEHGGGAGGGPRRGWDHGGGAPHFHPPVIFAKQAANIDRIAGRPPVAERCELSWWPRRRPMRRAVRRARRPLRPHARVEEVVDGAWREPRFSYRGSTTR